MVTVYHDLDYEDFYKLIAEMDIVVPAFADFGCESSQTLLGASKLRV